MKNVFFLCFLCLTFSCNLNSADPGYNVILRYENALMKPVNINLYVYGSTEQLTVPAGAYVDYRMYSDPSGPFYQFDSIKVTMDGKSKTDNNCQRLYDATEIENCMKDSVSLLVQARYIATSVLGGNGYLYTYKLTDADAAEMK